MNRITQKNNDRRLLIRKKAGSGLAFIEDPEYFKIQIWFSMVQPYFKWYKYKTESACSETADTSLILQQHEEENSEKEEQQHEKERKNESDDEFKNKQFEQEL